MQKCNMDFLRSWYSKGIQQQKRWCTIPATIQERLFETWKERKGMFRFVNNQVKLVSCMSLVSIHRTTVIHTI
uniref:Putative ovule protein n=1 Tax=Solanum chacoense TaxID=4108 RepID=A0A0V0IS78_SOLCH